MADRILSLQQQIALLPAAIPDTVLDFLEDFGQSVTLSTEGGREALDPDYLKGHGAALTTELEAMKTEMGALSQLQVDQGGREIPGGFLLKLTFEKGARGVGLLTKLKERTILRVLVQPGAYDEAALKELLKNPPVRG